jgi:hypothetical protein
MPRRNESPWHKLTVERIQVLEANGCWKDDVDYTTDHPTECDQLKYGQTCWFDGEFFELGDAGNEGIPTEPGTYRARVWMEGPSYPGDDYKGGTEWEPLPAGEEAGDAAQPS